MNTKILNLKSYYLTYRNRRFRYVQGQTYIGVKELRRKSLCVHLKPVDKAFQRPVEGLNTLFTIKCRLPQIKTYKVKVVDVKMLDESKVKTMIVCEQCWKEMQAGN